MARPTKPVHLYKHTLTGYIYRIAHCTLVQPESIGVPAAPFLLYTLRYQGRHPDDENTIVVSAADLADNFTAYQPIKADRPDAHTPNEETV